MNATEFGRWVSDMDSQIDHFNNCIYDQLKYWYEYEAYNDMIKAKKEIQNLSSMVKAFIKASFKKEVEVKAHAAANALHYVGTKCEFETPPIPYPIVGGEIKFGLSSTAKQSEDGIVIGNNGIEIEKGDISLQINTDNQIIRTKTPIGQFKFNNEGNINYITHHLGYKEYNIQGLTSIGKNETSFGLISNSPYGSIESQELYSFDKISCKSTIKTNPYIFNGIETSFNFEYSVSPKKVLQKQAMVATAFLSFMAGKDIPISRLVYMTN